MKITKKLLSVLLGLLVIFSTISCCLPMASAITSAERAQNIQTIYKFLTSNGYNAAVACGILANIEQESNFNPNDVGDNGSSYGICQWHDGKDSNRFTLLKTYCKNNGLDYKNINAQLKYLKYELESDFPSFNKRMKAYPNTSQGAYDSAYDWCVNFEKPGDKVNKGKSRGARARDYYWPTYAGSVTAKAPTITLTSPTTGVRIAVGKTLGVWGTVYPNGASTTITGKIIRLSDNKVMYTYTTTTSSNYDLKSSTLNDEMKFSKLAEGVYKFVITASNSKGSAEKTVNPIYVGNAKLGNPPVVEIKDTRVSPKLTKFETKNTTTLVPKIKTDSGVKITSTKWSSNNKYVTVDQKGNVTALALPDGGTSAEATITCNVTDSNGNTGTGTCVVKVGFSFWEWIMYIFLFGWAWYK